MQRRELPDGWDAAIPSFEADEEKGLATRKASNKVENAIGERVPWLIAGSADLTDSTSVRLTFEGATDFEPGSFGGRQLHFGIREHAAVSDLQRALALASCGRSGRPTSSSPTTPARRSGWRR